MKSVYRKFTDQIAADAARSAGAIPVPPSFSWLAGDWTWLGLSVRFANSGYGVSRNADPFLIHNLATGFWILVLSDPGAFGVLIGAAIRHGHTLFTGDVTIDSQSVRLRQSWRLLTGNEVEVTNERWIGGQWQVWDCSLLERVTPPN